MRKILLALALILLAGSAQAAVTANSPVTPQTPKAAVVQFLQGTDAAGTYKTLYTGGANGSKIMGLIATTNDATASHLVTCQLVRSSVLYGGVAATIPVSSGFTAAALPVNLMAPAIWVGLPADGNNPFFYLSASDLLQCTFATALTSTDVLNIIAVVWDF